MMTMMTIFILFSIAFCLFLVSYSQILIDSYYFGEFEKFTKEVDPDSTVEFILKGNNIVCKAHGKSGKEQSIFLFEYRPDYGFLSPITISGKRELSFYRDTYRTAESIIKRLGRELKRYKLNELNDD